MKYQSFLIYKNSTNIYFYCMFLLYRPLICLPWGFTEKKGGGRKKATMGRQNLPPLLQYSFEARTVGVTVNWSCVWSFQEKLGTITTRLIYKQIYQHLFLIGCWDEQLPLNSSGFAMFFFEVQNGSRHSKFMAYSLGSDQPRRGQ